ncbi:tryptophan synthase beta family domain-containing protein (plasmid) [Rhizobium gallicum bv. gallicum R602sp]|uniref:Tryptophan synthase beta family domain-containing protein n=1 Tax=Rhizobium gallicum bv. gallicum R602sp TaxID=1041138 RepID=A0A0B4XB97_9HYPH|nr:tryptophan synthase beta family domain-containing protein [Rhizobium gallicum bv. gallicum R602sp]
MLELPRVGVSERSWRLPGLAEQIGVGAIHIKDERHRLSAGRFKALGGAYSVIQLLL